MIYSNASGTSNKSLHIVSDQDISVFAINIYAATTDATNVLPVSNYGQSYRHISYKAVSGIGDGYTLVAGEDNTAVSENGTVVATLSRGQVYSKYTSGGDLTGTLITSDNPIAYFTTNTCVQVPNGTAACDCLFQQQAPISSWGSIFLVPVTKRGIERVRIVASQDGTTITQTGGTVITGVGTGSLSLNAGQFFELEIALSDGGCHIVSTKPVAVASFLTGTNFSNLTYKLGDPAMAWVPPIEQTVMNVALAPFIATGTSVLSEHHALIVTKTATKGSTTMTIGSGSPQALTGGSWTDNTSSGYSFYSLPLSSQTSTYYFENAAADLLMPDSTFIINTHTTLYAVWAIDTNGPSGGSDGIPDYLQFTVTYNGNGNTSGTAPVDNNLYSSTDYITAKDSNDLARTGTPAIVFAGWVPTKVTKVLTIADAASLPADFVRSGNTFTITANTTMYAVWSTDENGNGIPDIFETGYTVTYNGNGHTSCTEPDSAMYISGTTVTTEAHGTLAKTDAIFIGWSFASESLVIKGNSAPAGLMAEISTFTITGNTTLYAVWAQDVNGPDGPGAGGDNVPDYLQFAVTYGNNGGSGYVTDNSIYSSSTPVTLKDKGELARANCVFISWNPTAESILSTQAGEDSLTLMKKPGETFTITSDTIWHAVWAKDDNGNGIPDYKEAKLIFNKGALSTAIGLPDTLIVDKSVPFTFTDRGAKGTNYVLIGWHIGSMPIITSATLENTISANANFYAIGSSYTITDNLTLHAVWAIDKDNDGFPDYGGKIVTPVSTRIGVAEDASLLSGETGNEAITGTRIWAHGSTLYINAEKAVRAGIYTIGGMLYKQIDVPEGLTSEPLDRGVYIVNIDGVRHKVVVK